MSENYGRASRGLVQDTNAGKIHPAPQAAQSRVVKSAGIGVGNNDVVVDGGADGKDAIVQGLIGIADKLVDRSLQERATENYIKGANMVGTEAGRQNVEEMNSSWSTKLFGPNATLRGAQDTILKTHTDQRAESMRKYIDEDGFKLDDTEYNEYTRTQLEEALEPYEDPEIREQITDRYIQQLALTSRRRQEKHAVYLQKINMDAQEADIETGLNLVHQLTSGTPTEDDLHDATTIVAEMFVNDSDMAPAAHANMLGRQALAALRNGSSFFYEQMKAAGVVEKIDEDIQPELADAFEQYEQDVDNKRAKELAGITADAEDPFRNQAEVSQAIIDFRAQYGNSPELDKAQLASDAMDTAHYLKERTEQHQDSLLMRASWGAEFRSLEPEVRGAAVGRKVDSIINKSHRQSLGSKVTDENRYPTAEEKARQRFKTVKEWVGDWKSGRATVASVAPMASQFNALVNAAESNPATFDKQLKHDTSRMMIMYRADPTLFEEQFGKEAAFQTLAMNDIYDRGLTQQERVAELTRYHKQQDMEARGDVSEPDAERVDEIVKDIMKNSLTDAKFKDGADKYWIENDLFSTVYETLKYNPSQREFAKTRAIHEMNARNSMVFNRLVRGGAALDAAVTVAGTKETTFMEYLEGFDGVVAADGELGIKATLRSYGVGGGQTFKDLHSVRPINNGSGGAVVTFKNKDGMLVEVPVGLPSGRHSLPTAAERRDAATQALDKKQANE